MAKKGWHSFCKTFGGLPAQGTGHHWPREQSGGGPTELLFALRLWCGQRWLGKPWLPPVVMCRIWLLSCSVGNWDLMRNRSPHPTALKVWGYSVSGPGWISEKRWRSHEVWNPEVTGCISARAVNFLMKLIAAKCSARTAMETPWKPHETPAVKGFYKQHIKCHVSLRVRSLETCFVAWTMPCVRQSLSLLWICLVLICLRYVWVCLVWIWLNMFEYIQQFWFWPWQKTSIQKPCVLLQLPGMSKQFLTRRSSTCRLL